jgi:hypothetical protein
MADVSALGKVSKSLQHLLRSVIADSADFLGVPLRPRTTVRTAPAGDVIDSSRAPR